MPESKIPLVKLIDVAIPRNRSVKTFSGERVYIATGDLLGNQISLDSAEVVDFENKPSRASQETNPWDVIFAKMQATDKSLIIDEDNSKYIFSSGFFILEPTERILPEYLYHFLRSKSFHTQKDKNCSGATQKAITLEWLQNINIPLPTLEEQKSIVAKLDKLIELIDLKKEAIWKTEALTKSVFLDMFGDPILNNKNWEFKKVKDFSEIRLGKMLDEKNQTHLEKYDYLGNSNVQWGYIEYKNISQMGFSEKDKKTFELQYGDVLICEWWAIGRSSIWRENRKDIFFQKALHRLRPNTEIITSEQVYFIMKFYVEGGYFDKHKNSATISHLTWVVLKEIEFPIPPLRLQLDFVWIYMQNSLIIQNQKQSLEKLQGLYDTQVQDIFTTNN